MKNNSRVVFNLPKHPVRGKQSIVVEKPHPDSVWMLVLDKDKYKPLVRLSKKPKSAKEVLDSLAKSYGEDVVAQYVMGGFSKL